MDDLHVHIELKKLNLPFRVFPAWRPDKSMDINSSGYTDYLRYLGSVAQMEIDSLDSLKAALVKRLSFFHENGCRISDHALLNVSFRPMGRDALETVFAKALRKERVTAEEEEGFRTEMLLFFGREYAKLGWAMQYHIGALRNNNTLMYRSLGADKGFDSVNDESIASPLSRLLDTLDMKNQLPKTILYSLNPKDNYTLATMLGNFQRDVPGKLQMGSAWWFNDQRDGMEQQIKALANLGLLGVLWVC